MNQKAAVQRRILVVDDDPRNRRMLELILSHEGFRVELACTGEDALTMVVANPPDLILLDVILPGLSGYDVLAALKADPVCKNVPTIMLTALDDREARLRGLSGGAEDFLSKPVDRAELCARVKNLLRLKEYGEYYDKYSQFLEGQVSSSHFDLQESKRWYQSTFDNVPVGIVHADLRGGWIRVNQRLCDLLGYPREQLQQDSVAQLLNASPVAGEEEALAQLVAGTLDHYVIDEKAYQKSDGSLLWARVNVSLHNDLSDLSRNFILVIEDITERRALEGQLLQATKMNAIGQLASGVAHDFNNLLNVILGYAELLSKDATGSASLDLAEILNAARSASNLTKQLLAFGRQQMMHPQPVDLNLLVQATTGMLGRLIGPNIVVNLNLAPDLSRVLADRGQLEQVLINLVVNAKDAMPNGGRVLIETREMSLCASQIEYEAVTPGTYVELSVSDTGAGMTADVRDRIFEPFFSTKEPGKGTGLGLSTSYGIVRQSKGYITVESEPERGTTFRVYLPPTNAPASVEPDPPKVSVQALPRSATVLLVDDEPGIRMLSSRILAAAGYHVVEAGDGVDAERAFLRADGAVDLLVTDTVMPLRGGRETAACLRVHHPSLRVLFMSGYTDPSLDDLVDGRDTRFIQKPFSSDVLLSQVRDLLSLEP